MKHGKKYLESVKLVDSQRFYDPREGMDVVISTSKAKFDETVELHVKLGVDSRHADQQVRGAIVLPHGTGKTVRVLVFAKGDKADAAREAGAEAHSRSEGGPAADAGSGPVTRDEGESAGASADGEPPADEQGAPSEPSGGKTCGCATTASALPMGALLLAGLGLGIRRRAR